jgi:hypothetical protein
MFGGILGFTLIPEENWVGGLRVLGVGSTWGWRRGGTMCQLLCNWGTLFVGLS